MSQGNGLEEGDCPLGLQVLRIAMGEPAVLDTPPFIPLHFDSPRQGSPILTMCYVQGWQCTRSGMSQSPGHSGC